MHRLYLPKGNNCYTNPSSYFGHNLEIFIGASAIEKQSIADSLSEIVCDGLMVCSQSQWFRSFEKKILLVILLVVPGICGERNWM